MSNYSTITKPLEKITACGQRASQIFDDLLDIAEATLRRLPDHAKAVAFNGDFALEDPADVDLWAALRKRYPAWCFAKFSEAFAGLLDLSYHDDDSPDWKDAVGDIYQTWGHPSTASGQFFTPFTISKLCAEMTGGDIATLVRERVDQALQAGGVDVRGLGMDPMLPYTSQHIAEHYLPTCIEHYDPVRVSDPAIGSGGMCLAVASILPPWMIRMGLVQFSGQDIDRTCVQMCRINFMLYGLNSYGMRLQEAHFVLRDVRSREIATDNNGPLMLFDTEARNA